MHVSIYLHSYVTDILAQYGKLDDVVNDILSEASRGAFSVEDKPRCIDRQGASRYTVNVINEEYLTLMRYYPPNSSKISLRRLIYWFVDNEVMNDLGWKPCHKYINKQQAKIIRRYENALDSLTKLQLIVSDSTNKRLTTRLTQLYNDLISLREDISNA